MRIYRVALVILGVSDLPEREPDYQHDWNVTLSPVEEADRSLHAFTEIQASNKMSALTSAVSDLADGFGSCAMGRTVSVSCEAVD